MVTAKYRQNRVAFTNKSELSVLTVRVPNMSETIELNNFLNDKPVRVYKSRKRAENFVNKLKQDYLEEVSDIRIEYIDEEILHPKFNGCPQCGSNKFIEINFTECFLEYEVDPITNVIKQGISEQGSESYTKGFECSVCSCDLGVFDFSEYGLEKSTEFFS
ncbi:hypothetical protein [Lactobacillus taiwanensis]|uniref:hypothetical protein n=1 Tax=Lactobacillus taiwanensis TaxID=508451 RepID=UPI003D2FAD92